MAVLRSHGAAWPVLYSEIHCLLVAEMICNPADQCSDIDNDRNMASQLLHSLE